MQGDVAPWGWRHDHRSWRGPGLAVRVGVVQVLGTAVAAHGQHLRRPLDLTGLVLLAAGPAVLALGRRHATAVLAANVVTTGSYYALGYRYGPAFLGLVVSVLLALGAGRRRETWALLVLGYGGYLALSAALHRESHTAAGVVAGAAVLALLVLVAERLQAGRERARAAASAHRELRRRQASEERLRIAQELHDTLGHHLSVINVQSGVALHLDDPGQTRTALAAIRQASHEALDELRDVLAVLKDEGAAPRAPVPGLARLDELVQQSRDAGLDVEVVRDALPEPLPATVDRAAYRIVQEALTNVRRHARASCARVGLHAEEHALVVEVSDDGTSRGVVAEGNGIEGMRQRAVALGGSLQLDRSPAGGLLVRARLPVGAT